MADDGAANRVRRRRLPAFGARHHFSRPPGSDGDTSPSRQRFFAIHRTLRDRIAVLHYPPGMRIDIDELAREFEVSRTPIRSVLQRLEYQGLVIARHGVGTTVADIDFEHLRDAMAFRMRLAELIGDLSPREPDETGLADIAAAAADCAALEGACDLARFARIDIRVHTAICGVIGHPLLLQIYDELFYNSVRLWYFLLPRLDWDEEVRIFRSDIEATRRAMQRGDARAVGFLTRNALSAALTRLSDLLDEMERDRRDARRPVGP